jgi:hypothetical protein
MIRCVLITLKDDLIFYEGLSLSSSNFDFYGLHRRCVLAARTIQAKQIVIIQLYFIRLILHKLQGIFLRIFFLFVPRSCYWWIKPVCVVIHVMSSLGHALH